MAAWTCLSISRADQSDLAVELLRISNDLRLLAGGPTSGMSEIFLP